LRLTVQYLSAAPPLLPSTSPTPVAHVAVRTLVTRGSSSARTKTMSTISQSATTPRHAYSCPGLALADEEEDDAAEPLAISSMLSVH
jgi:hypothetical protein